MANVTDVPDNWSTPVIYTRFGQDGDAADLDHVLGYSERFLVDESDAVEFGRTATNKPTRIAGYEVNVPTDGRMLFTAVTGQITTRSADGPTWLSNCG